MLTSFAVLLFFSLLELALGQQLRLGNHHKEKAYNITLDVSYF